MRFFAAIVQEMTDGIHGSCVDSGEAGRNCTECHDDCRVYVQ
jgi:hypothetical protein